MSDTGKFEVPTELRALDSVSDAARIEFDDRGNAIWKPRAEANPEEAMRRLLNHPSLAIVPDPAGKQKKIGDNPHGLRVGYDPLDSGALEKRKWREKKDLRRLSEWIVTKRSKDDPT